MKYLLRKNDAWLRPMKYSLRSHEAKRTLQPQLPSCPQDTSWLVPLNASSYVLHCKKTSFERTRSFCWWEMVDSDHRSRKTTDLQSAPFGHSGNLPYIGAGGRTWTPDLLITNQLLYRLSYTSVCKWLTAIVIISPLIGIVNTIFQKILNFLFFNLIDNMHYIKV